MSLRTEQTEPDAGGAHGDRGPYVSRGGIKLENALRAAALPVRGRKALDIGASTGGFTDCLLQAGAAAVTAVDVGYGQFDWGLRNDPRVHILERVNARALTRESLDYVPDLAVIDVSFISIAKVLPAVLTCLSSEHDVLALVKPQFEVGRANVGKGGVVRSAEERQRALVSVAESALQLGECVLGYYPAGIAGPKGNRETFLWSADGGRGGGTRDPERLPALATAAEPAEEGHTP